MVDSLILAFAFLIVAALSFAAGIYLAKKEIVDAEKVKLPELPSLKPKPRGAILRPISQEEAAIKREEELLGM